MRRGIKNNFRLLLLLLMPVLIFSFGCSEAAASEKADLTEIEEGVEELKDYGNTVLSIDTDDNLLDNLDSDVSIDSDFDDAIDSALEYKDFEIQPTLKLEIYGGPYYAEEDTLCLYRIKAIASGEPEPEIIFSRDDAKGALGKNISQVNLRKDESYTLVAKAKNSAGEVFDYITLSWVEKADDKISYEDIDFSCSKCFKIDVNLSSQVVRVYYNDHLIKEMICSGGTEETPTPLGDFVTSQKIEYSWVERFNIGAFYWIRFYGNYLFHSVPFDEDRNMIEEEFEKLGTPASHGCIRLALGDAKWLYDNLPLGVKVSIHF